MSYGTNLEEVFRRAGDYVDNILRGAKAGDLPVEQPTKFELAINRFTANAVGLTVPEDGPIWRNSRAGASQPDPRWSSEKPCRSPATKQGRAAQAEAGSPFGGSAEAVLARADEVIE